VEYAYLVASLPRLVLGEAPPLTTTELVRMSEGVLSGDDWAQLRALVSGRYDGIADGPTRRYLDAEIQLRNALTQARAARASVDSAPHLRPHAAVDARAQEAAARAMAVDDPLERELMLDRHRWALLEELAALPAYGVQAVLGYALRLGIVEKWWGLTDEQGVDLANKAIKTAMARIVA
jgi:hypothetical protein